MASLRDFVADTPAGTDPAQAAAQATVLDALSAAFTPVPEAGTTTHRLTWLDTFDWRLYRAGLTLRFEHARRGGGRLLLNRTDGTPQAEQPVTTWPRRPRLAEDLPDGPVRDRIIALTSPRALLPIARAITTVGVTRLLNPDGKTVARLVTDHTTVTAPGITAPTAELPARLAVTGVRGYPGQARKAAALVAAVPGLGYASQTVFTAALTALGRHPSTGGSASSTEPEITAAMPAPVAVARLLLRLLDTLELNVDGVLRDIDTEFLHDLRVAVRRTRSALKLLGGVLPADLTGHYAAEFKWLGDLTTPTRDLDVHLLGFDAMASQLADAGPADLEPLRAFLVRRRAREFRKLARALRGPRFRAITDDWRKELLEIRDAGGPPRPTAAGLAWATTGRSFRRIATQGGAITAASPPESLHNLRKRAKELRYLLEFFAPLHDPVAYRKVVSDLKQLQDCLGAFQDSEVQRAEIHDLADAMLAERAAPAATLLAMGEIAARLALDQAGARAEFAARFARFAGPAGRERVRVLLEGRP
jgi:CHAD domain-containing protein